MELNMITIGKRIRERRKELNLTQTDIYHKCGIASGALSQIENGNRTPSIVTFYALSQALDCNMEWLATGISTNTKNSESYTYEEKILADIHTLPKDDQEEFLGMLQLRIQRIKKKLNMNATSSPLEAPHQSSSAS